MGLRFRKSIKIAPGVKVNFNKKSVGVSVGKNGARLSANSSGRKTATVGIPGTGISYTQSLSSKNNVTSKSKASNKSNDSKLLNIDTKYTIEQYVAQHGKVGILIMTVLFGYIGGHHFFLTNRTGLGWLYFFTVGVGGVGWISDIVRIILAPNSKTTNSKALPAILVETISDYIIGLLWFENGPYANYKTESKTVKINYGYIEIEVNNILIKEPSLINIDLPIAETAEFVDKMGYYPSYAEMTPDQRKIYLNWLNDITQSIDIGYVFVFYYGLERHLIFGNFEDALECILTLRKFHNNNSFQAYSSNALFLAFLLTKRQDILDAVGIDNLSINIQIMLSAIENRGIRSELLIKGCSIFGFTNKRYITGQELLFKEILDDILLERYESKFFPIYENDFKETTSKFPIVLANFSVLPEQRIIYIPDIASSKRILKEAYDVLCQTHEAVKARLKELRKAEKAVALK